MPSLVEIGPVVLEKKMEMWKVYDNANDDNDGQRTNFDQKSSLEPLAQVSLKKNNYPKNSWTKEISQENFMATSFHVCLAVMYCKLQTNMIIKISLCFEFWYMFTIFVLNCEKLSINIENIFVSVYIHYKSPPVLNTPVKCTNANAKHHEILPCKIRPLIIRKGRWSFFSVTCIYTCMM